MLFNLLGSIVIIYFAVFAVWGIVKCLVVKGFAKKLWKEMW